MQSGIGISSIACYEPKLQLDNSWYRARNLLKAKYEKHTGIESRKISLLAEPEMAVEVCTRLMAQTRGKIRLDRVKGLIIVSTTHIPKDDEKKLCGPVIPQAFIRYAEDIRDYLTEVLDFKPEVTHVINWGCSGYVRAMKMALEIHCGAHEYILIVTTNQSSRLTDYEDPTTGHLFGDFASATLVTNACDTLLPYYFRIVHACATDEIAAKEGQCFRLEMKKDVLEPNGDGERRVPEKLCMWMNGMGVAEQAPRIMYDQIAAYVKEPVQPIVQPVDIVPHQAGLRICEFLQRMLDSNVGTLWLTTLQGDPFTKNLGNITSSSLPYALSCLWRQLRGCVICPTAGVDLLGRNIMTGGILVLHACT